MPRLDVLTSGTILSCLCYQDVTVSSPGMPEVQFVGNRWLAVDQGDGQCTVTLLPVGAKGAAAATIKKYRVHVSVCHTLRDLSVWLAPRIMQMPSSLYLV